MATPTLRYFNIDDIKAYFDANVRHVLDEQNKALGAGFKNGGWMDWEANLSMLDEYYNLLELSGGNKMLALDELPKRVKMAPNSGIDGNFYQYAEMQWLQAHGLDGQYKNLNDYYRAHYQEFRNQDASIFQHGHNVESAHEVVAVPAQETAPNAPTPKENGPYNVYWKESYAESFNKPTEQVLPILRDRYNYHLDSIRYSTIDAALPLNKGVPTYVMMDLSMGGKKGEGIHLYRTENTLLLHAHGSPNGTLQYHGKEFKVEDVIEFLEANGKIDDSITDIYTLSCFGGNQTPFVSGQGRKVRSSHNSNKPIVGSPKTQIGQAQHLLLFGIDEQGDFTPEFKEFLAQNEGTMQYLNANIQGDEVIYHNIFDGLTEYVEAKQVAEADVDVSPPPTPAQDVMSLLEQYGAYSDEFYQQQGMDPVQQRLAVRKLYEDRGKPLPEQLKKYFPDASESQAVKPDVKLEIDFIEPLHPVPSLNELYQQRIDERIHLYKEQLMNELEQGTPGVRDSARQLSHEDFVNAIRGNLEEKPVVDAPEAQKTVEADIPDKPKVKAAKVADATQDATKTLPKKQLGSTGKLAIGAVIAGLVIGALLDDDDEEESSQAAPKRNMPRMTSGNYYEIQAGANDAQIAANISSYGYGRRVGGFM